MTNEQAVITFFANNPRGKKALEKIMNWNEGVTLEHNAESLGITFANAHHFKVQYNLKCKKKPRGVTRLINGKWVFLVR